MRFKDRIETAKLLAEKLKSLQGKIPIVPRVPWGALPMVRSIIGGGAATHLIMMKTIHDVRMGKPAKVILAVVLASEEAQS